MKNFKLDYHSFQPDYWSWWTTVFATVPPREQLIWMADFGPESPSTSMVYTSFFRSPPSYNWEQDRATPFAELKNWTNNTERKSGEHITVVIRIIQPPMGFAWICVNYNIAQDINDKCNDHICLRSDNLSYLVILLLFCNSYVILHNLCTNELLHKSFSGKGLLRSVGSLLLLNQAFF